MSPDGSLTIVGCVDGSIRVYNRNFKIINKIKLGGERITDLKISPNG
jgi:hypothetical protein